MSGTQRPIAAETAAACAHVLFQVQHFGELQLTGHRSIELPHLIPVSRRYQQAVDD